MAATAVDPASGMCLSMNPVLDPCVAGDAAVHGVASTHLDRVISANLVHREEIATCSQRSTKDSQMAC